MYGVATEYHVPSLFSHIVELFKKRDPIKDMPDINHQSHEGHMQERDARGYKEAVRKAFPYTVPVLTGYLFIGIAFGVMYAEKGYSFF